MRNFARRYPIALYLAIVFGLGVPLMMLGVLAQRGIIPGASLPAEVGLDLEKASALAMVLLALFPAAVIVTALDGGRPAVATFFTRIVNWRIGAGWWALILLALPTMTVLLARGFGDTFNPPTPGELLKELGGFLFGFVLVNWWEESSWAGFMQTRLEQRHNLFVSAALTAIPFAGIHMPLQLLNGTPSPTQFVLNFLLLTVLAIVVRSYFGLVMRGTGGSLLAVGVSHTIFNRSNNTEGIAALLLEGPNRQAAALLATLLLTIALGVRHYRGLRRK
jgi:membrane protease YdiL (CAAX protease family)